MIEELLPEIAKQGLVGVFLVIVGVGYFVDDFTSIGLDFRYLATKSIEPFNSRNEIASLNVTLNGSFDCG